jgi:hypothetical protein
MLDAINLCAPHYSKQSRKPELLSEKMEQSAQLSKQMAPLGALRMYTIQYDEERFLMNMLVCYCRSSEQSISRRTIR